MVADKGDHLRSLARFNLSAEVLTRPRIAVQLPPGQEGRRAAVSAFMMAANMMVRLFHNVTLLAPDVPMPRNPWMLKALPELLPILKGVALGRVTWNKDGPFDVALGIGKAATVPARRQTFIAFSAWRAAMDTELGAEYEGPIGALFASCYGVAQTLLLAAQDFGADRPTIPPFVLSLLDPADPSADAPVPELSLDGLHLVGAGAVGSAFVYGLGHLDQVTGKGHAIDNDDVDDNNLLRYLLMRHTDLTRPKVKVMADVFSDTGGSLEPHEISFRDFRDRYGSTIELMLTPIDSEEGRCALAK